jgi:hypothetical protein
VLAQDNCEMDELNQLEAQICQSLSERMLRSQRSIHAAGLFLADPHKRFADACFWKKSLFFRHEFLENEDVLVGNAE